MSFFDKKINVSKFTLDEPLFIDEIKGKMEKFTAPKLNTVDTEIVTGWSNAEDLTSTNLDNAIIAEKYLYANMRISVKKLPSGLFKMVLAQKISEYKKENGKDFIPSKVKKELKEEVAERLLPSIAPTVKNIWVIFTDDGEIFAGTTSKTEKQLLYDLVYKTLGADIECVTFEKYIEGVAPAEFFTDIFRVYDVSEFENRFYTVLSPFTLESTEESPCVKTGLSGLNVEDSSELTAALKEGKLFSKIRLSVASGLFEKYLVSGFVDENDIFTFTINANGGLDGVVLPECETFTFEELFVERTELLKSLFKLICMMAEDFSKKVSLPEYEAIKKEWIEGR